MTHPVTHPVTRAGARVRSWAGMGGTGPAALPPERTGVPGWLARHPVLTDVALALAFAVIAGLVDAVGSGDRPRSAPLWDLLLAAPLVLRRRRPAQAAGLIAVICLAQWLAGVRAIGDLAFLVALYSLGAYERRRWVLIARVLILTTFDLDEYAFEGLRAGASGFLLKNVRPEDLLAAIRSVTAGDAVVAPSTTRRLLDTFASAFVSRPAEPANSNMLDGLTVRELDVFAQLADGCTNKEIAAHLCLSETTVKTHVVRILAKLDLRDRIQAVIFAYETGIKRPQL